MSCHVQNCHSLFHCTNGHVCSLCSQYGHGEKECEDKEKLAKLQPFLSDIYQKEDVVSSRLVNKGRFTLPIVTFVSSVGIVSLVNISPLLTFYEKEKLRSSQEKHSTSCLDFFIPHTKCQAIETYNLFDALRLDFYFSGDMWSLILDYMHPEFKKNTIVVLQDG